MSPAHHVVVDGSNLATEGRTVPSLAQLDEAVRAYLLEDPEAEVVVVVDASFSHRIAPAEQEQLEAAELHGEVVAPPAGAIGRGDAFVLRIAERTGAVVLSNDSFQEFHDEHPWLFDEGRLVGGKPVPGVGWIFTPRRPVRGPRSRKAARDAEADGDQLSASRKAAEVAKALQKAAKTPGKVRAKADAKATEAKASKKKGKAETAKGAAKKKGAKPDKAALKSEGAKPPKVAAGTKAAKARAKDDEGARKKKAAKAAPAAPKAAKAAKAAKKSPARGRGRTLGLRAAIDQATEEVLAPLVPPGGPATDGSGTGKAKRRRRVAPPPAVNEPLAFLTFVALHPLGSSFEGVVESFTSHGAMVDVALPDGGFLHCYAPLTGLGSPPPRAAREVLARGQRRDFCLVGLDPARRMAELALPELAPAYLDAGSAGPRVAG